LPATFRDAVKVSRALGCRYLWIDSLCIIQGDGGDFNQEAKHMEQVYSGAYCVLAVSRAASHYAGFLHPRKERDFVALGEDNEPPFYICENIDDFNAHVLEGDLNSRGWVLQEHALARRTIFFTEHQAYWECGEGVRCETMMRMRNDLAAFLGDPSFPRLIETAKQGERIIHYQNLYKRYARLGLTNDYDRPMAIDGLQHRILGALKSQGGFGVFDEGTKKKGLLRRSLLWHRANETPQLKRIVFPKDRTISVVPSWSWMAYTGAIEYEQLEFGGVEWEELQSPWSGGDEVLTEMRC
ncbi:heterokaryon incompatibility protein-domain-containing protein, partial [Lasiosphaeria hispida]